VACSRAALRIGSSSVAVGGGAPSLLCPAFTPLSPTTPLSPAPSPTPSLLSSAAPCCLNSSIIKSVSASSFSSSFTCFNVAFVICFVDIESITVCAAGVATICSSSSIALSSTFSTSAAALSVLSLDLSWDLSPDLSTALATGGTLVPLPKAPPKVDGPPNGLIAFLDGDGSANPAKCT